MNPHDDVALGAVKANKRIKALIEQRDEFVRQDPKVRETEERIRAFQEHSDNVVRLLREKRDLYIFEARVAWGEQHERKQREGETK